MGDASLLLPDGIDHLADLPFPLHDAINLALQYLNFEELPREEQPPRAIWDDGKELTAWFKEVERKRKADMNIDQDKMSDQPIDGPVSRNAAMEDLIR